MKHIENNNTSPAVSENFRFFSHDKCEYFPCHKTDRPEKFNCLFCYCPLYVLGSSCGGNYQYTDEGYKDCSECMLPHGEKGYDHIVNRYQDIVNAMSDREKV